MLQLLCNIGWHHGTWTYVPGSCDQVNTCPACGKQRSREQHNVRDRQSDGFNRFLQSMQRGLCVRCNQWQRQRKPPVVTP